MADLSGLVANYTFTENSNDSVAGRNLTVGGGAPTLTTDRFGAANRAYAFNGASFFTVSDSIPTQLPLGTNPRTMCVWYKLTILGVSTIVQYGTGTSANAFGLGNDNASQYLYTYTYQLSVLSPAPLNTWTHFCASLSGSSMAIYINGNLAAQASTSSAAINTILSSLNVGKSNFQGDFVTGSLDEVRIYNRGLSAMDIAAVYAEP